MKRLEEYVRDHKNRFDEEPVAGNYERLQQKMLRRQSNHRRLVLGQRVVLWSVSIAASIAIVLSAVVVWQRSEKQNDRTAMCDDVPDMKICYLNRMNAVANEIEKLAEELDEWDRQLVMTDVRNILEETDNGLEHELPDELSDDRARQIFSDYYRQNLEGLETIEQRMKWKMDN